MGPSLRISGQDALTVSLRSLTGNEAAILRKAFCTSDRPDRAAFEMPAPDMFVIRGSSDQLRHCFSRLSVHPQVPDHLRRLFAAQLDNALRTDYKIVLKGRTLDLGSRTHVMGILNVTPDSFSDGGRFSDTAHAVKHAEEMAAGGADIIDIGGESTRPGAEPLSEDEELRRILPVIERASADLTVPVSVDTYKAPVARRALEAGAAIVNDISGLRFSPDMARIIADHGAAVVVMHIKGTPRNMQANPGYDDVMEEIIVYLAGSIDIALRAGIPRGSIMIDPGIGFGKTVEHNLTILRRLDEFRVLGCPIVLGTSRKRFIGAVLDISEPRDRKEGTAATVALGIERGAHILRVHDVAEMTRVARMTDAIVRRRTDL